MTKPMSELMKKKYDIPAIARHLKSFCEDVDRAKVLTRSGKQRNLIYRFQNLLMESYVLMRGISAGLVEPDVIPCTGPRSSASPAAS
jgi:hypothetical protein